MLNGGAEVKKTLDTEAYLENVTELLQNGKASVPVPVTGGSMTPFICEGDTVYLDAPRDLKRGDIVLYRRKNGRFILHRIASLNKDGTVTMIGDAQTWREVLPSQNMICGKVSYCIHKGKRLTPESLRWRIFATVWLRIVPLRRAVVRSVTFLKGKKTQDNTESEK